MVVMSKRGGDAKRAAMEVEEDRESPFESSGDGRKVKAGGNFVLRYDYYVFGEDWGVWISRWWIDVGSYKSFDVAVLVNTEEVQELISYVL